MRIRTLVGAVVVAAGLSATLTGAAGAAPAHDDPPPADETLVVTCEDGRAITRPLTDEERKRIEDIRERGEIGPAEAGRVIHENRDVEDGDVMVFRGDVPPDGELARREHGAPDGRAPQGAPAVCAVPALPLRP